MVQTDLDIISSPVLNRRFIDFVWSFQHSMILSPSTIAASFHISGYDVTSRVVEVNIQKFQYFVLDTILQYNLDRVSIIWVRGNIKQRERILSSDCDYWCLELEWCHSKCHKTQDLSLSTSCNRATNITPCSLDWIFGTSSVTRCIIDFWPHGK